MAVAEKWDEFWSLVRNRAKGSQFWWRAAAAFLGLLSVASEIIFGETPLTFFLMGIGSLYALTLLWAEAPSTPLPTDTAVSPETRETIAQRVRTAWEVSRDSLTLGSSVPLRLQQEIGATGESVDSVEDFATLVGTRESVILVGHPGAGKTDFLGSLVGVLTDRVLQKVERALVPVALSCAGWAQKRLPIDKWAASELRSSYRMTQRNAEAIVGGDDIVLLLDGLDEIPLELREEFARRIGEHQERYGPGIVLSCRTKEWSALQQALEAFHDVEDARRAGAGRSFVASAAVVRLLPISSTEVEDFLAALKRLEGLAEVFPRMPVLSEALNSPLALKAAKEVFDGWSAQRVREEIPAGDAATFLDWLLEKYANVLLARFPQESEESGENGTPRWLGWLAFVTRARCQSVFYLDSPQLDWLSRRVQVRTLMAHFVVAFLVCGLPVACALWAASGLFEELVQEFAPGEVSEIFTKDSTIRMHETGPWLALVVWAKGDWPSNLLFGLLSTISAFAVFGSYRDVRQSSFAWDWRGVLSLRRFPARLLAGTIFGLTAGVVFATLIGLVTAKRVGFRMDVYDALSQSVFPWIGLGVAGGILAGVVNAGVRDLEATETLARATPEALVRASLRNGLFVLVTTLGCTALAGFFLAIFFGKSGFAIHGFWAGFVVGLPLASCLAWCHGIGAWLWNRLLRRSLSRADLLPADIPAFLYTAAAHDVLRLRGGGYAFVHPRLRDVLATHAPDKDSPSLLFPVSGRKGRAARSLAFFAGTTFLFFLVSPSDDHIAVSVLYQQTSQHLEKGELDDAQETASHALAIEKSLHSSGHLDIAIAEINIANVGMELGNFLEAKHVYEIALGPIVNRYSKDSLEFISLQNHIAAAEHGLGNNNRAVQILENIMSEKEKKQDKIRESDPILFADIMNNLGNVKYDIGRYDEAWNKFDEASYSYEPFDEGEKNRSRKAILISDNMGKTEIALARQLGECEKREHSNYEKAVAKADPGPSEPDSNTLKGIFGDIGNVFSNMKGCSEKSFSGEKKKSLPDYTDPKVKNCVDDAEADHVRAVEEQNSAEAKKAFSDLDKCSDGEKAYYEKAQDRHFENLKENSKRYKDDHPRVAVSRDNLGMAWFGLSKYQGDWKGYHRKAWNELKVALDIVVTNYGEKHQFTLNTQRNVVEIEIALGDEVLGCYADVLGERGGASGLTTFNGNTGFKNAISECTDKFVDDNAKAGIEACYEELREDIKETVDEKLLSRASAAFRCFNMAYQYTVPGENISLNLKQCKFLLGKLEEVKNIESVVGIFTPSYDFTCPVDG